MQRPTLRRLFAMMALIGLVSGCAEIRGERQTQGIPSEPEAAEIIETSAGEPSATLVSTIADDDSLFAFTGTELYGRSGIDGLELVAEMPLIMTFVVPSCSVCVLEGPEIAASAAANPDITYVVVHSAGSVEDYEAYVGATGLYFENIVHLDDSRGALWRRFGITQQPTTFLVGADGDISRSIGALELDGLEKASAIVMGEQLTS